MPDADWRAGSFPRRRPSTETLEWVAASIGTGGRVTGCRRMTGGVSSAVHGITVQRGSVRSSYVLRQYPGAMGLNEAVRQEVENLTVVAHSGLPVPRVVAADIEGGRTGGAPSLLMTRLPGHVDITPADPGSWLRALAELAARVHALDLPAPILRPWQDSWIAPRHELRVPAGAHQHGVWTAAFAAVRETPPAVPAVFLHGDFLPVNVLWSRDKITGLVDWNGIHRGPRTVDIGHCRRYLAALYSPEWAQQLRSQYEVITGQNLDPWWDIYALLHHDDQQPTWIRHQVAGRRTLDETGATQRVETILKYALQRLG